MATLPIDFRAPFHTCTARGTTGSFGNPYNSGCPPNASTVTTPVPPTPGGSYTAASGKPFAFNCSTRWFAIASMSPFVPNCRQLVGQAFTHAGCSPTPTRSTHSVHLYTRPVSTANLGTSNGQPVMQ